MFEAPDIVGKYSDLPTPPLGPVRDIAYWIYSHEMTSPNKNIAIVAAWMLVAAFAGRKDNFLNNPPLIVLTVLGINGIGKDVLLRTLDRLVQALSYRRDDSNIFKFGGHGSSFGTGEMVNQELGCVSGVRITSEAGLTKQSTSGDTSSVRASALQNAAANAYARRNYRRLAKQVHYPWGVNMSVFDESTDETFLDAMSGTLGTGEAARNLMVRLDASAVGETRFLGMGQPIPNHILDIFDLLAEEALRGENLEMQGGVSSVPVPFELQKTYQATAGVIEWIKRLEEEDTKLRRANKENQADLNWAQSVRNPQLTFRLALVHARTRQIVNTGPCLVEEVDFEAATSG